jgi:hypothetical protein
VSSRAIRADNAQSLEQLVAALARKGIPLPYEIGTFLVLESCERLIGQPLVIIGAGEVWLSDEGEVMLAAGKPAPSEMHAARALVVLLGELLVRSAPGVPQMVLELVEHSSADDQLKLGALRDDLEATLVPLNRAATRRVLSRLLREARKERERGASMPAPDAGALDDELDALLGVPAGVPRVEAAQEQRAPEPQRSASRFDHDDLGEQLEEAPTKKTAKAKPRAPQIEQDEPSEAASRRAARAEPRMSPPRDLADELEIMGEQRSGGSLGSRLAFGLLAITLCLAGAYFVLGKDGSRKLLGLSPEAPAASAEAVKSAPQPEKPRYGELRVSSSPARAQVLLLIGKAPAVVRGLPVGLAHELIAVSEGRSPARGIVPADAAWTEESGALQYELALQLNELKKGGYQDLGSTRLPQTAGTPTGASGNVRVITSPPGANVYQLIGFTPDVRVENLDVREPAELLVYLAGYEPQRVTLTEGTYKLEDGKLVADLEIALQSK